MTQIPQVWMTYGRKIDFWPFFIGYFGILVVFVAWNSANIVLQCVILGFYNQTTTINHIITV